MALQKQNVTVNFAKGLDTKTDPFQVSLGAFAALENSVFNKGGQLTKRNGFNSVTTLPLGGTTHLTTFKDTLVAAGSVLQTFNQDSNQWINAGPNFISGLDTTPLVRTATSQTSIDVAVAPNNLACATWLDSNGASYYQIADATTGSIFVFQTALELTATNSRVFVLGNYFIVTYLATISGSPHLRYVAIPLFNPAAPLPPGDLATVVPSLNAGYDGFVVNNALYFAYSSTIPGPGVRVSFITDTLIHGSEIIIAGDFATRMAVNADTGLGRLWVTFLAPSNSVYTSHFTVAPFVQTLAKTPVYTGALPVILNLTASSITSSGTLNILTEVQNSYTYTPVETHYVRRVTLNGAGVAIVPSFILKRGVGLGSKSWVSGSTGTLLNVILTYGQAFQPTYFAVGATTGNVFSKVAYANGGGYITTQILPQVTRISRGGTAADNYFGYLFVDLLVPVNKAQGAVDPDGVYTQTGINLAKFFVPVDITSLEIGNDLHISGGYIAMYDGAHPVEHQFFVWPEDVVATTTTPGAVQYFYQAVYEWTDAVGNIHRSAPSIPTGAATGGPLLSSATPNNTINVPTLRLTFKTQVRIVLYRWSSLQQNYYQIGGPTFLNLSNPNVDSIAINDTFTDAQILGNALIYTTGGVIEDIAPPASRSMTLFKSRLFLVDSENPNLLWFSKQVIQNTPVEMSDLLTIFVAPTLGSQGSTGAITGLSNMDDKLIIFKENAIYYITGTGPDNTGANNDFSDPIFISSAAGCTNQSSIVQTPNGLMFQSNKGIWLLGRDLSTSYIGAPVEEFNSLHVNSAQTIPGTNQVRFTLEGVDIALMYDYYFGQWGTFSNIRAIDSVIYRGLHTYLTPSTVYTPPVGPPMNIASKIVRETPGVYMDDSNPVSMAFTTSWVSLAGLQGYERFYFMHLLGVYYSPFKLDVQLAYDFGQPTQSELITPANQTNNWGGEAVWGSGGPWGGPGNVFEARLFPKVQKCSSFQISVQEVYDASYGVEAGQGLTLSGLDLTIGAKKGYRTQSARRSFG